MQRLQQLGWNDSRNMQIDIRWAPGDADRIRRYAAELVTLAPDVIVASDGTVVGSLLQATRTVPILFTQTADPVGAGFVDEPGAAGRQRHRIYQDRIRHEREMAGTAQRDRAAR